MSGEASITDVENMMQNASTIGGASADAGEAVGRHMSRLQSLGDFLSNDQYGQVFKAVYDPVNDTTAKAGSAASQALAGTAVNIGNHAARVVETDSSMATEMQKLHDKFPNDFPVVVVGKQADLQTALSSQYPGSGKSGEDNPGLFGTKLEGDPTDTELGRAVAKAREANGDTSGVNYAAFKCVDAQGNTFVLAGPSAGMHSEKVVGIPLIGSDIKVIDIYSERQPCDRNSSFCGTWLQKYFGTANGGEAPNVTYSETYETSSDNYKATKSITTRAKGWLAGGEE